jgi:hypothetical protein
MNDHRKVLRSVGFVLVAIGVADIGLMIYCIATGQGYSSSLNIFAVIAGVYLINGSLVAARVVTWFAAFLLTAIGGTLLMLPFIQPLDLWLTEFRLSPLASVVSWLFLTVVVIALGWAYWRLRSEEVVRARIEAGHKASPPLLAFALGIALVVGLTAMMHFIMSGENSAKAIDLARSKAGPNYKYHVTAMNWSNSTVRATVTAYNAKEIKSVEVQWDR